MNISEAGSRLLLASADREEWVKARAIEWARANDVRTIAMTGFKGGRSADLAEVNLHVTAENYGIVEDIHQSMMHALAQYLRQSAMSPHHAVSRAF
jgi:D-sedoheptulose 7-phosphate isomerase